MRNTNTFDLNLVRIFDALMREGSVSAAANRLGLSQPAVSNALYRLRSLLRDPLFVRTRHGMEPTAFALRLCGPLQDGLAHIRTGLSQEINFEPATSDRTFALLMNDVGAASFLPAIVKGLSKLAPTVNLKVRERDHAEYEDALDSGAAELAVGRVMLSKTFRSEFLMESRYVAVLDPSHPALKGKSPGQPVLGLGAYLAADHVVVSPRGSAGNPVERAFASQRLERRVALNVPHATALINVLPNSSLIATVPDRCVEFLCQDGRLIWAELPIPIEPNMIYQWWHKRYDHDAGHRWLRGFIADAIRQRGKGAAPTPQRGTLESRTAEGA